MSQFYKLSATQKNGATYDFADLKGKVVLVVNTASACGFTPQYKALEELNKKYHDQGLQIVGFPCNQFGSQEKGTDDEIATFCQVNFGVSFPLMKKSDVNGDNTNQVFQYLKSQKSQLGMSRIKWNFEKFLIDREGNVVSRYSSMTKPESMSSEIEKLLAKNPPAAPTSTTSAAAPTSGTDSISAN